MRNPDFLILSLPRSRSAWLANFMTTDTTLCLHDPTGMLVSGETLPDVSAKIYGWADTALGMTPDIVRSLEARTLIIERDPEDVIAAVEQMGLPIPIDRVRGAVMSQVQSLKEIRGLRVRFEEIDNRLGGIWSFLTLGQPFDGDRANLLKQFDVQLNKASIDKALKHLAELP